MTHRILIADDVDDVRSLLEAMLEGEGWQIETATDGRDAQQKYIQAQVDELPYDLLVLDAAMPEMSGTELADWIRTEGDEHTKILMVSAYADPVNPLHAQQMHAVAWLQKPVEAQELKRAVSRALDG